MEKTNSNIPTLEELKAYIDESGHQRNRDIRPVRFRADGG